MPPRVLIVEHELVTAEPLMLILSWAGFPVRRVHDAAQALVALAQRQADVVLVNEKLPHGRGGLWLCRRLREEPALPSVPVVVFGAADESDVRWREAGAAAFLRKPIELRLLPAALAELVRRWSKARQAEAAVPLSAS